MTAYCWDCKFWAKEPSEAHVMKVPMITIWVDDWGDIVLPDDFPASALTNSGLFDKRYKVYEDARNYIADQSKKLEAGIERPGFRAPSFYEWRKAH